MSDLGVSKPYPDPPGVAKAAQLKAAGFSDAEVNSWAAGQTQKLQAAGFKPSEIADYWGNGSPANAALANHVRSNLQMYTAGDPKLTTNPVEAFAAGWDRSVTGLAINRQAPTSVTPENAGIVSKVANSVGQFAGDLPFSVAGMFGGAAVGGGGGAAAAAPTGEVAAPVTVPVGAVLGGGFGFGATPEAARQILLDAYAARDGKIKTWEDAVHVIGNSLWETTKEGVTGAVTNFVGGKAGGIALKAGASKLVAGGVNTAAATVSGVTTASALNGHMPDARDFTTAAILAVGLHTTNEAVAAFKGGNDAVNRVQHNMEDLYRKTGVPPWEAAQRANSDPVFRQELYAQDVNGEPVTPNFRNIAPGDPPPFKPEVRDTGIMEDRQAQWRGTTDMLNVTPGKEPTVPNPQQRALPAPEPTQVYAKDVPHALSLLRGLEGSAADAVSPKGAIGHYQIMPGTARQYMGADFDVKTLFDPQVNEAVATRIVSDLFKRYNGDMNAIAIAYNAGPGRAGEYLKQGPGTGLVAVPDKAIRGGYRYETINVRHDESHLPDETQRYLARARSGRGASADMPPPGGAGEGTQLKVPSYEVASAGGGGGEGGPPGPPATVGGEPPGRKGEGYEGSWSDEIMRNVGQDPKEPSVFNLDRIMSQFVSELTPFRNIDNRLVNAGEMDRAKDVGAEDMARQTYGSDGRTAHFVRFGAVDPITLTPIKDTPSIMDAVAQVRKDGGNMKEWTAYMLAKRTMDKAKQGIDTGFNPAAAEDGVTNAGAQKRYERGTKLFNDVMNSVLNYSRESGVHSQEQVDAMIRDNPSYISMRRIMGDDASFEGRGRNFATGDRLKLMEGSDREIVDPIKATLDNMRLIIAMADRNRLAGHIVGMAERGETAPELGIKMIEDSQTIKAADEDVFKPYGLPPESDPTSTYAPELAIKRGGNAKDPNSFVFIRDGKPEVWTTSDPLLAKAIRGADSPGAANIVMKTFQTFASVERAGIVVSPDFPTKVTLRHQITAFIADPLHPPPFITWLRGIGHVIGQDDEFQKTLASGGFGTALADMDRDWLAKDMDKVFEETGTWDGVANAFKHPLEFAQIISERMDAGARVGYRMMAEDKGISPTKAGAMSRKAYLDYAEKATAGIANGMAQVVPFFRPHILGLKQFGEAMGERPGSTLAYGVAAVAIPTVLLYALNHLQDQFLDEKDKWANIPQWQKDNYFITPVIGGTRFRLRYPPNTGFVMGGMLNRLLDTMVEKDAHAFEGWAWQLLREYIPPTLPTVTQAPLEVVTNHNFFTGLPLIPSSMERDTGYMQYTPATSETGKALSRALGPPGLDVANFSPIQFDQYIKGWTGGVGQDVLKALDIPFSAGRKPGELADIPFVGSFLVRNPGVNAKPVEEFFTEADKLQTQSNDFKLAMKRAEQGNASEIDYTAAKGQTYDAIAGIHQAVMAQINAINGINSNKEMSAAEKRQNIDNLLPQLIETARQGTKAIDELNAATKVTEAPAAALPTPPPAPAPSGPSAGPAKGTPPPPPAPSLQRQVPIA